MNIYVGNLSHEITEEDLHEIFQPLGKVESINLIKDKYSGDSKGFGFVEMPSKDEGIAATRQLNGTKVKGKSITVNEARPKSDNRGSYRGGRGGSYGWKKR